MENEKISENNIENLSENFSSLNSERNEKILNCDEFISNINDNSIENFIRVNNPHKFIDKNNTKIPNEIYPIHILIVDDNMFNILIITKFLKEIKEYKFIFETANNGLEAYYLFKKHNSEVNKENFLLLIMDCEMPIMNGFESAKKIKKEVKIKNMVDVIILAHTSFVAFEEENKIFECGMNGYIVKSCKQNEFNNYISKILGCFQFK